MKSLKMIMLSGVTVILTLVSAWAGEWTQKISGASPRLDHSSVLHNGKLYIFGGANDNPEPHDILFDLWEYDISNNIWTQRSDGPAPRDCHSAVIYNDRMYVFGGWYNIRHNDLWEYDISNDVWTVLTTDAPPPDRNNHMAVVYNDKMYIFGGRTGENDDERNLNDLWEYDFSEDKWTQKTNAPISIRTGSAVVFKNNMYIFGGTSDDGILLNTLLEYDFVNDKWTEKARAPFSSADHSAVISNDKMFLFGGGISDCVSHIYLSNRLLEYDFPSEKWKGHILGSIQCRYGHTLNVYDGKLYVYGGKAENFNDGGNEVFYDDLWEYHINDAYDVNGDGKTGLEESIQILKIVSGEETN